jgi:hypothetical protein
MKQISDYGLSQPRRRPAGFNSGCLLVQEDPILILFDAAVKKSSSTKPPFLEQSTFQAWKCRTLPLKSAVKILPALTFRLATPNMALSVFFNDIFGACSVKADKISLVPVIVGTFNGKMLLRFQLIPLL